MRAKTAVGMLIAQPKQNFRARETKVFEQVPRVRWQAGAMRIHVADSDFARYPRIEHFECRIKDAELRVPGDFSFTDQFGNYRRANRFGKRRELKDCVRINQCLGI